jgi:TonB family protein
VFCDADVATFGSVDMGAPPNPRAATARVVMMLDANAPGTLSGDVVLLTDDAAYDVPFSDLQAAKNGNAQSGITAPLFVGFSKPLAVRYAWVDSIGLNGAAPHPCPSNPYSYGSPGSAMTVELPPNPQVLNAVPVLAATFRQALPPPDCGEPYRPAKLLAWGNQETDVWDTSTGLKAAAQVRVFLDSDGKVAGISVVRSSGSAAVDALAAQSAARARYQPAIFRCVPVVSGTELIDMSYEVKP